MPGPPPKPADQRARRNKDPIPVRVVEAECSPQPDLPDMEWHPQTRAWWRMWGESPLSDTFTANDWNELIDTALIHSAFWNGEIKMAGELRQRVAKFGATPEDRARLRITFATADTAESKKRKASMSAAERRRLRVVGE